MLDKLPVKCKVCNETGLSRGNFGDHIQKYCVKYEVPCLLANINCSWSGQRDQLKKHLDTCDARGTLRPLFDQFIGEIKELTTKIDKYEDEIHRLKSEINQLQNQKKRQDTENDRLKCQETQAKIQIDQQRHEIRVLKEEIRRLKSDNHNRNQQTEQQMKQKLSPMSCWLKPSESSISISLKWMQSGMTVAGSNRCGRELHELNTPYSFAVDDDQSIYIADTYNHRIVVWRLGIGTGKIILGGRGQGNLANQLNYPSDIIINKTNGSLIICDRVNKRILQCSRQNGSNEQTIIENIDCIGLAMNKNGHLYVSNHNNHEIRRFKLEDTIGTVVAGGNGRGDRLNQLAFPTYLFVDDENSIYISDSHNNRIVKWKEGAKKGVIVAGGHGEGNTSSQLHNPNGILVDRSETIYVADTNNNRVVCWPKGATDGIAVVGCIDAGKRPNEFENPMKLSFDRDGHLYVADSRNHRVQRFDC